MLYGAGSLFLQSKELDASSLRGENLFHPLSIASFELSFEDKNIEAKALIDGKRQIVAAAIVESVATLTLTFEYMDWQTIGLAYDEISGTTSSITLPQFRSKRAVADSDSANIVDADITASMQVGEDILVFVASKGAWGDRKYLKASDVTVVAGKLELPVIYDGAVIQYSIPKTYTSIETIGVEANYDKYGKLMFQGVVSGTEFGKKGMGIIVPELSRISTPTLKVNGELAEMTVEFRASVPIGQRSPFQFYNLDTAS